MNKLHYYAIGVLLTIIPSLIEAQTFAWAKRTGGSNTSVSTPNWDRGIAIDGSANIYSLSSFSGTADFDPGTGVLNLNSANGESVVQKFDAYGGLAWTKQFVPKSTSLATDNTGNTFLTGFFSGTQDFDPGPGVYNLTSSGYNDIFVVKLDMAGNFLWARQVGGIYDESHGYITVSNSGVVYVTGSFGYAPPGVIATADFDPDPAVTYLLTSAGGTDGFILALDGDGKFLWVRQKGTSGNDVVGPVAADGNENIVYAGFADNRFIEKITSDNNLVWNLNFGQPQIFSIATDPGGNILLSGGFGGTQDFDPGPGVKTFTASTIQDSYNAKLDANGNFVWATHIKANGTAQSIVSDASGNVYTTGNYWNNGNVDFDPGLGTNNLRTNGRAMYIQKLTGAGAFVWAVQVTGDSKSRAFGRGIVINGSNDVLTNFEFSGTVDVDPGSATVSLKAIGSQDKVLHMLRQSTATSQIVMKTDNSIQEEPLLNAISVFPIPNNGRFFIQTPVVGAQAQWLVYDMTGRVLGRGTFDGTISQRLPISLDAKPKTAYLVEVRGIVKKYVTKVAVN